MTSTATMDKVKTLSTNRPRILIADDQLDVLEALRLLLKGEGYQIDSATSPGGAQDYRTPPGAATAGGASLTTVDPSAPTSVAPAQFLASRICISTICATKVRAACSKLA